MRIEEACVDLHSERGWLSRTAVRTVYALAQFLIRLYTTSAYDLKVIRLGAPIRGPKVYVTNHVSSTDPYWLMVAIPEFLHFVVGPPYKIPIFRRLLKRFEQINALPEHRNTVVESACRYLAENETVCILPEGDIQPPFKLGHFFVGPAKIFRCSNAPLVPVAIAVSPSNIRHHPKWDIHMAGKVFEARIVWRGKVRIVIGQPIRPELRPELAEEEDNRRITDEVKAVIQRMLEELERDFPT